MVALSRAGWCRCNNTWWPPHGPVPVASVRVLVLSFRWFIVRCKQHLGPASFMPTLPVPPPPSPQASWSTCPWAPPPCSMQLPPAASWRQVCVLVLWGVGVGELLHVGGWAGTTTTALPSPPPSYQAHFSLCFLLHSHVDPVPSLPPPCGSLHTLHFAVPTGRAACASRPPCPRGGEVL